MKIAIVDDSAGDRQKLLNIVRDYAAVNGLELSAEQFSDGEELLRGFQPYAYTIIFLDIYMEELDGIETARRLREHDDATAIVFLTTSEEHRTDAFAVFASACLGKPCVEEEEVFRAMDHILHMRTGQEKRISFSYERRDYSLRLDEIVCIEVYGNYLTIESKDGKRYRTRMTLRDAEAQLDGRFLKLIKGVVVNLDYVTQMTEFQCILRSGTTLPIHSKNRKNLFEQWMNYKFSKLGKG